MRLFHRLSAAAALLASALFSGAGVAAAADSPLPELAYDPAVPTAEAVFGFPIGERHFSHDELLRYFEAVAAASPRVRLVEFGRTHERRRQVLAFVSTPQNLANLEELRRAHLAHAEGESQSPGPLVVWLGYSVHGNEASGAHASAYVAYHLAAAPLEALEVDLSNTVVILEPSINPDGLQRFSSWVNTHRSDTTVTDKHHREFREAWPGGRTNHYWFDLNRDWLLLQQPESRARVAQFQAWLPHVLGDYHEMGTSSTYFFQPGIPTRNNPNTPRRTFELTDALASYHAAALDGLRQPYYSEESFDDFYYGKGSTYPDLQGSVGVLFEQASARGLVQDSPNGKVRFTDAIRNQVATSRSLLRGAQALRAQLAAHQRTVRENALADGREAGGGWTFATPADPQRAQALAMLLAGHDIEVYRTDHQRAGATPPPAAAFAVPAAQVRYPLVKTLFERVTEFADTSFYDVSAWNADLAYDVDVERVGELPPLGPRITRDTRFANGALLGTPPGQVAAYVLDWTRGESAPAAIHWLVDEGLRLRVMTRPFDLEVEGRTVSLGRGAVVLSTGSQDKTPDKLAEIVRDTVRETGAVVYAVGTSLTPAGPDLGARSSAAVTKPKVLLVGGEPTSAYEVGEVWHLLDQRLGLPATLVDADRLRKTPLGGYSHVVMVDGDYDELDPRAAGRLREYACAGGTVIAQRRAAKWWVQQGVTRVALQEHAAPEGDVPYGERADVLQAEKIAGAILHARVDVTHPLGFGLPDAELPVFRDGELLFQPVPDRFANVARYAPVPRLSGYVSDANRQRLAGSPALIAEPAGKGRVVLFADVPNFRAYFRGSQRLFVNALLWASAIEFEPEAVKASVARCNGDDGAGTDQGGATSLR